MKKLVIQLLILMVLSIKVTGQDTLLYHTIQTDDQGHILPWNSKEPGSSYNEIIDLIWNFWDTMRVDMNGVPYYMNHQVWRPDFNDPRGLGGDQLQMALSSWALLYAYTGNERVKENMKFLADYYLANGLSPANAQWPSIPYPYNTLIYSGKYDGDMVIGLNYTQPDKAGSFGWELLTLFKMMSNERYPHATEKRYLDAAVAIANTLVSKIKKGDENRSPLPFKVNAISGEVGKLKSNSGDKSDAGESTYTTNWAATIDLFLELIRLKQGNVDAYRSGADELISWMKQYPMSNNKWGPFFEDIPGWSDTQINAMTWARFIMRHREMFPEWKSDVQKIINWVYVTLGNQDWMKYGVTVINEQTAYQTPGNSHTSRQAADELLFASLTGDAKRKEHAVLQLNWATYMVDNDGKNRYPRDENWLTDGYGDYVRHYLRAMAAAPELAPANEDHLLSSTSVVQQVGYRGKLNKFLQPGVTQDLANVMLYYTTYDKEGTEILRLMTKPSKVLLNNEIIREGTGVGTGYSWVALEQGGALMVKRMNGGRVVIYK